MKQIITAATLLLCLAACSPEQVEAPDIANEAVDESAATPPPSLDPLRSAPPQTQPAANILTLEGLGALRIGEAVPANSGWAERGAQISDECRTVSSPDFPGVYAIVEGGRVRRVTVDERSDVKLIEGIGTGATEAAVRDAFPGFREASHEYVDAPAKYLTAPGAAGGDPALRFEIGEDGKVSLIHVGTMPVLGYVEGCA